MNRQITDTILMIRPHGFQWNEQTAVNNYFQKQSTSVDWNDIQKKALKEFDALIELLDSKGVSVIVVEDQETPKTPDAVFPNNWVSFHENGKIYTYPMFAENRRFERRADILEEIAQSFKVEEVISLNRWEDQGYYLEGTGSLVLDREHKLAYVALSDRAHQSVIDDFEKRSGYKAIPFHSLQTVSGNRPAIYHTNVMMYVGEAFAVVCTDSIDDKNEQDQLVSVIKNTGKKLIEISEEQVNSFAGNGLQIMNNKGDRMIAMSTAAFNSMDQNQLKALEKNGEVIHSPLKTIECYGGGSARCMMAEIFLSRKDHV